MPLVRITRTIKEYLDLWTDEVCKAVDEAIKENQIWTPLDYEEPMRAEVLYGDEPGGGQQQPEFDSDPLLFTTCPVCDRVMSITPKSAAAVMCPTCQQRRTTRGVLGGVR